MKNLKENDFADLDRAINTGSFIVIAVLLIVIFLFGWYIVDLNKENDSINKSYKETKIELSTCNKRSYERFELAKDLTEICDRFRSSRTAKTKYMFENGIID